ncbi:MAG: IscS subfamily cysteine desulfurase [Bacilli bacterium]
MYFFDYASTSPVSEQTLQIFCSMQNRFFGNSGSLHDAGTSSMHALTQSRKWWANMWNCDAEDIIFTSSGTESNMLAIETHLLQTTKKTMLTTATAHASVGYGCYKAQQNGYIIETIPIEADGLLSQTTLLSALHEDVALVVLTYVNSDIGIVEDISTCISTIKSAYPRIAVHVDCVQAFGKFDVQPIVAIADSVSVSAHKWGCPKGVGVLYLDRNKPKQSPTPSATHEFSYRPGTVNVPLIVTATQTANDYHNSHPTRHKQLWELKQFCIDEIANHQLPYTVLHPNEESAPHILALMSDHVEGQWLMLELNRRGFCVSVGSACTVGKQEANPTLLALGYSADEARRYIRISFGDDHSLQIVEKLLAALQEIALHTATFHKK